MSSQSVQNILIWRVTYTERPILVLSLLMFSQMISELITFNHLRCQSSSTVLGTRTGYWKPTQKGTDETPQYILGMLGCKGQWGAFLSIFQAHDFHIGSKQKNCIFINMSKVGESRLQIKNLDQVTKNWPVSKKRP